MKSKINMTMNCVFILLCACGKSSAFKGQSKPQVKSEAPESASPAAQQQEANRKLPAGDIVVEGPIVTRGAFVAHWKVNSNTEFQKYKVVLSTEANASNVFTGDLEGKCDVPEVERKLSFDFEIPDHAEGKYILSVTGTPCSADLLDSTGTANVVIDKTPPKVDLFLGAVFSNRACVTAPTPTLEVATRTVPFDYCIHADATATISACLRKSSLGQPAVDDACWMSMEKFTATNLALLANGPNTLSLFVMDEAKNIGEGQSSINLNPLKSPKSYLMEPSSQNIIAAKWNVDDVKTIKWVATDDDTDTDKIKFIVSLFDTTDESQFKHVACNFSNSPAWQLCPVGAVPSSPLFKMVDKDEGISSFDLKIPTGWDSSRKYIVVIQIIDKSGNTSIISTQEINSGWEVVAGRTYPGNGSSGNRINMAQLESLNGRTRVRVDAKGQVYLPAQGLKRRAFDGRTCRALAKANAVANAFDCDVMIKTDDGLHQTWAYDRHNDTFYTYSLSPAGKVRIVELDFNAGTVKTLIGDGASDLKDSVDPQSDASSFKLSSLSQNRWLSFEDKTRQLFFIYGSQLYSINSNRKIKYILGKFTSSSVPTVSDQANVKQRDLVIPNDNFPFVVTNDQRILIGGDVLPSRTMSSVEGSQYIINSVSFNDADQPTSLLTLTNPSNSVKGPTEKYLRDVSYDPIENRIFASLAYDSVSMLQLPAKTATKDSYTWTTLVDRSALISALDEPATQTEPFLSYSLAYAGANQLYFSNISGTLSIFSLQVGSSQKPERAIGMPTGVVESMFAGSNKTYAVNQTIDFPMHLDADSNGNIIFNDFSRFFKVELKNTGNEIHGLQYHDNSENGMFKIIGSKLYQSVPSQYSTKAQRLFVYDLTDSSQAPAIYKKATQGEYANVTGISNNLPNLKIFSWNSNNIYQGTQDVNYQSFLQSAVFTNVSAGSPTITISILGDLFSLNKSYCGANGQSLCTQGAMAGNAYPIANYRLVGIDTRLAQRQMPNGAAFAENDNVVYTCLSSPNGSSYTYAKIRLDTQKIYLFTAKDGSDNNVTCGKIGTNAFRNIGGTIYLSNSKGLYKLNSVNSVELNNTAVFQKVDVEGGLYQGEIGDLYVNSTHVYYTETRTNRVLRSKILP